MRLEVLTTKTRDKYARNYAGSGRPSSLGASNLKQQEAPMPAFNIWMTALIALFAAALVMSFWL